MTFRNPERSKFPQSAAWAVFLICALPPVLNAFGFDFGTRTAPLPPNPLLNEHIGPEELVWWSMRGAFVYTLLEWTAFCIALVTVLFSVVHYLLTRDIITPVVGTALFLSGCLDGFQVLAADMITETGVQLDSFIPLAWMISRTVNAVIVLAGTTPFLWRTPPPQTEHGLRYILLVGVLFTLMSFTTIHLLAIDTPPRRVISALPEFIHRPLDLIPLALYLLAAGIVLPRFYRKHRSLFARGLHLSVLPHVISQLYAVTSAELYDNAFNVAIGMKIVGYLVPLVGLIVDYSRSFRARGELHATREQMRLAHDIQVSLLPDAPPRTPDLDVAGRCRFAEVVGGDYFDYLRSGEGTLTVVLADVSGHDFGASLLMANTRAYLRVLTESPETISRIAERVSEHLGKDARGRRFATMFLARIDAAQKQLEYVGAGHEAYLFRAENQIERLESTGAPLGVSGMAAGGARTVSLNEGDILVMVTDGVLEARNDAGALFGLDGVKAVIRARRERRAEDLLDGLFSAVARHRGNRALDDDATAVIVKL